jgi:FAD binding domain
LASPEIDFAHLRGTPSGADRCHLVLCAQPQATSNLPCLHPLGSPLQIAAGDRAHRIRLYDVRVDGPFHPEIFYKAYCNPPRLHLRLYCFPMPAAIPPPPPHVSLPGLYQLLRPITVDRSSSAAAFENCGRTFRCTPSSVFRPETEYQIQLILELARRERQTVRAVGVGHSPSDLACTSGYMIQMDRLDKIIEVRYRRISLSIYCIAWCLSRSVAVVGTPGFFATKFISRHEYTNLT